MRVSSRIPHGLLALLSCASVPLAAGCAPEDADHLSEVAQDLGQPLGSETEPNGSIANATPLAGDNVVVRARISVDSELDFYSFTAAAGDKIYVATMTSFSPFSTDTVITLLGPDGTTVIEEDDDNGSISGTSSVIAGATIPAAGTYYLRVKQFTTAQIQPYDLHFRKHTGAPVPETEPNDMPAAGATLPASGWVSGTMSSVADVDIFTFNLNAGDTVFAALDLDPERDGTEFNGTLAIGPFAATFLQVNDAGNTGPDAEATFVTATTAGTYGIGVLSTSGASNYTLSVSILPAENTPNCTTYTSTDIPKTIPTGPGQVTSTITIPNAPRVADLDVSVQLTHTAPADIDMHLISPAGNDNGLLTDVGSTAFTTWDVRLDDEAAFPASTFTLINGFTAQPESVYRLSWFDGENAGGTWTLVLDDDTAAGGGTLQGWSITVCEPPALPACGNGAPKSTLLSADFELNDGGFTHSGTQDEWERGTPSFAPITTCNSGTSCWKTDLDNTYNASASEDLVSAPINLVNMQAPIHLQWAMKYQMAGANVDHAYVEVREVGGLNPKRVFEHAAADMTTTAGAATLQESAGWGLHTADISSFAGKQVEVVFHVDSDATTQRAGLAVDDVSVVACPAAICGNNVMEPGETCDDGNTTSGDGCDSNCTITACGNNVVTMGETCDDGNLTNGDGCDSNCTPTGCGNGIATTAEVCDDGNAIEGDGCDSNCTVSACGNNIVAPGEACDDGNLVDGDGCDSNCTATGCGNGIATMGEACDDGNAVEGDGCDTNCTASACGNNIVAPGEGCDDGNLVDGDGCDSNCTMTACGNGIVTMGEVCDDGNGILGDGCDDGPMGNCTVSMCGNGIAAGGEGCDDGNAVDGDGCDTNCTVTGCGNGILTAPEVCDDGNPDSGDGCDANCTLTACGNGVQTDGEECDDGNPDEGDGCDTNCTVSGCGNNITAGTEECDDGNLVEGDGCDSNCTNTACGNNIVTDEETCDDGNDTDGDGCDSNCTPTGCGNAIVTDGETCDDGNTTDGDGCSATCQDEGIGGAGGGGNGGNGGNGTGGRGGAGQGGRGGAGDGGDSITPEGGCACTVPTEHSSNAPWASLGLIGLGLVLARRRKR